MKKLVKSLLLALLVLMAVWGVLNFRILTGPMETSALYCQGEGSVEELLNSGYCFEEHHFSSPISLMDIIKPNCPSDDWTISGNETSGLFTLSGSLRSCVIVDY